MRFSNYYIKTLKETPKEAEVASHKLLLRAGMIKSFLNSFFKFILNISKQILIIYNSIIFI